jgi:hypothetical protein
MLVLNTLTLYSLEFQKNAVGFLATYLTSSKCLYVGLSLGMRVTDRQTDILKRHEIGGTQS